MKIQGEKQILHCTVRDSRGRRLGRVVSLDCAPDPYTARWLVLRLPGWREQLRAVPAAQAEWQAGGPLTVPYRRDDVARSAPLARDGLRSAVVHGGLEAFHAALGS